jgi:glycosyltransferase involved in cell wall biosynthesis
MSDRSSDTSPGGHVAQDAVVFCQHGISDPLVHTLILDYVLRLTREGSLGRVLFFTEEPPGAVAPAGLEQHLAEVGINWQPQRYDLAGWQWWQKLRIIVQQLLRVRLFVRGKSRCWLIGFLSYGGGYAWIAQRFGLGRAMVVCFEPHSAYMVEMGVWAKGALRARAMAWLERRQMRECHALVVPTEAGRDLVRANRSHGNVQVQPITIDTFAARFDAGARTELRARFGFHEDVVLVYAGKFGGIYHTVAAYMEFLDAVLEASSRLRALIITQQVEIDRIMRHPAYQRHAARIHVQGPVPPDDLPRYLSAADVGVVAIPPTPAQAFRTPVKSAYYWAAGLPLLICAGVSDDYRIVSEEGTGLVVTDLVPREATNVAHWCDGIGSGDREALRAACMASAEKHRDTRLMVDRLRTLLQCV